MRVLESTRHVFSRRLFRGAALSTAVFASMAMSECPVSPDASACGSRTQAIKHFTDSDGPFPAPENAYIDGGQAHFDWGFDVAGLCVDAPEADNIAVFSVHLYSIDALPDLGFEGRVYHAAFINPYRTTLRTQGSSTSFSGRVENVGLRQGNPLGGAAEIALELHMSFNSSGNIEQDLARALNSLSNVTFAMGYTDMK